MKIDWRRVGIISWVLMCLALITLCAFAAPAEAATVTVVDAATHRTATCQADVQPDGKYARVTAVSVTVFVNCDPILKSGFE